jgi:hypothetical protein
MSTYQCGQIASLAYGAPNIRVSSIGGYILVRQTATPSGYNGASFYNKETNSVVVASGGTASVPDVSADIRFGVLGAANPQLEDAKKVAQDNLNKLKAAGVKDPNVTLTGHSLGGHLSNKLQDYIPVSKSVTFNSPDKGGIPADLADRQAPGERPAPDHEACGTGRAGHQQLQPPGRCGARPLCRLRHDADRRRAHGTGCKADRTRPEVCRCDREAVGSVHGQEGDCRAASRRVTAELIPRPEMTVQLPPVLL